MGAEVRAAVHKIIDVADVKRAALRCFHGLTCYAEFFFLLCLRQTDKRTGLKS